MLANRGEPLATSVIIDRLWEANPPRTAPKVVNVVVGRLRRALEPDLVSAESSRYVFTTSNGYRIAAGPTDLDRYELLIARASETADQAPNPALTDLDEALALWGAPWAGQSDEAWLAPQVAILEERHRRIEELWADLALRGGRSGDLVERLQDAVSREPLRERRWAQLILGLYRAGRQADALRAYEQARTLLRDDLGIDPGRELRRLHLALLEQDTSLDHQPAETKWTATVTSFVGREQEMTQLALDLPDHRLITVIGIGGIGKSRLVDEFVHRRRLAGDRIRRAGFATLAEATDIELHLAGELGLDVDTETAAGALDVVVTVLGREPTILVLDAVENVAGAVGLLVLTLAGRCPRLRIIATSRIPLSIPGERLLAPDPLPIGDATHLRGTALELLMQRAGLSETTVTEHELVTLEARCVATGGVPLLVELAAATATSSDENGDEVHAEHHVAVERAIEHAMSSVDERACELLVGAAVLPDGVTDETAAALTELPVGTARRAIRQLAWVHLVDARAGLASTRYQSLDPIRETLLRTYSRDERSAATCRAVRAVEGVYRSVRPEGPLPIVVGRLDAAEDEHANLEFLLSNLAKNDPRAGLELSITASGYWPARGHGVHGRKWIETMVAASEPDGPLSWRATLAIARVTRTFAEIAELRASLEQSVSEMHDAGERSWCLESTCIYLAIARAWHGDRAGGGLAIEEAKSLNDDYGSTWAWERADKLSALDRAFVGNFVGARDLQREHAARLLELEDPCGAGMAWYLAAALGDLGGRDDVVDDIERARELATTTRDLSLLGRLALLEARFLRRTGSDRSRALLAEAADRLFELGGIRSAALARRDLGLVEIECGELTAARANLRLALPLLLQLDRSAAALAAGGLAAMERAAGNDTNAGVLATAARAIFRTDAPASVDDGTRLTELIAGIAIPDAESTPLIDDAALLEVAGAATPAGSAHFGEAADSR